MKIFEPCPVCQRTVLGFWPGLAHLARHAARETVTGDLTRTVWATATAGTRTLMLFVGVVLACWCVALILLLAYLQELTR